MNQGSSNRQIYDRCAYAQYVHVSTTPLGYRTYMGNNENCNKCRDKFFYHPYDLVDLESELRNQTRPLSNCGEYKHNPMNSKFNPLNPPVVLPPECCSILYQNIPTNVSTGVKLPDMDICNFK